MTYFEHEMEVLFGDSEYLAADTVFSNKTMISKISEDLRAKVENSNLLVAHVIREKGGAATCLHMAEMLEKPVVRI